MNGAEPAAPYALLDSGGGRKLEQVGPWIVDRTAPQAFWSPALPPAEWRRAHARHHRSDRGGGRWEQTARIPETWPVAIEGLTLHAKLTPFGHLGLFAEHAAHWSFLTNAARAGAARGSFEVLNLFAYTGGATLACARGGASVCHVDAAKGVVDWARSNAVASGLATRPIRWIVDDCAAFLKREARRGHRYDALILDPPSYGRSGRGLVWKIEDALPGLLDLCRAVLAPKPAFILFSCHSPNFSPIVIENLLAERFERPDETAGGEMAVVAAAHGRALPAGVYVRWGGP